MTFQTLEIKYSPQNAQSNSELTPKRTLSGWCDQAVLHNHYRVKYKYTEKRKKRSEGA